MPTTFDKQVLYGFIKAIVICSVLGLYTWFAVSSFGIGVICGILAIGMIVGGGRQD